MSNCRSLLLGAALLALATPAFGQGIPRKHAALMEGYPAFDAPIIEYALRHAGINVRTFRQAWLPTKDYAKYALVVVAGDLARAKVQHSVYDAEDLKNLREFLEQGGILLLMRGNVSLFAGAEGQAFLRDTLGAAPRVKEIPNNILKPDDPWIRHLAGDQAHPWLKDGVPYPVAASKAERIIGSPSGYATLLRAPVGKGQIIYVGWEVAHSLPIDRKPSTFEQDRNFEEQAQILVNIAAGLFPAGK